MSPMNYVSCICIIRTGSPHRVLCIMYYVLCIMYYALPLGVNIVCYVLCITYYAYYALRTGSPHRLLCITYYVLRIMYYALGVHIVCYVLYVLCIVYDASYIAHFRQAHHVCVLAATFYVLAAGTCTYYENIYCSMGLRNITCRPARWGAAPASSFLERAQRADRIEKVGLVLTRSVISPEIYVTRRPPASSAVASAHTTLANLWQP